MLTSSKRQRTQSDPAIPWRYSNGKRRKDDATSRGRWHRGQPEHLRLLDGVGCTSREEDEAQRIAGDTPACHDWPLPARPLPVWLHREPRILWVLRWWQSGRCAICGTNWHGLAIDHDHETNLVRGLLCSRCNYDEGWIDVPLFAAYRRRHPAALLRLSGDYEVHVPNCDAWPESRPDGSIWLIDDEIDACMLAWDYRSYQRLCEEVWECGEFRDGLAVAAAVLDGLIGDTDAEQVGVARQCIAELLRWDDDRWYRLYEREGGLRGLLDLFPSLPSAAQIVRRELQQRET